MSKRRNSQTAESPFSEVLRAHQQVTGEVTPIVTSPGEGKRLGKSTDPDFAKLTCYVRKNTLLKVKRKLLDQGEREISDLVEELMGKWIE